MKVRFTAPANADLRALLLHYIPLNPRAARKMSHAVRERCLRLSEFPRAGPVFDRQRLPEVRRVVVDPFVILYRVRSNGVEILRVVHGARDLEQILNDSPGTEPSGD